MPETVSLRTSAYRPYLPSSPGVSPLSGVVAKAIHSAADAFTDSVALYGDFHDVMAELSEISRDCSNTDWDGFGALRIPNEAAVKVEQFLYALPNSIPAPEISPEPDGSLALMWHGGRHLAFTISFQEDQRVTYAGIDGTSKWHGVEVFNGRTVSPFLLNGIQRVIG